MPGIPPLTRAVLAAGADAADRSPDWPSASWDAVRQAGAAGWSVPADFGGTGLSAVERLTRTEAVAAACLTTAFVLSQHEAAVRQLLKGPPHLQARHLPAVAAGPALLTVGLSQLTTSRQHGGPALQATPHPGGYRLDGEVPWVTAADRATAVVVGATLPDDSQLLAVLPAGQPGVTVGPPLPLAALAGSRTTTVRCDGVEVTADDLLAGPTPAVLGAVGGGGLDTSCLAIGVAAAATGYLRDEAAGRPHLAAAADRFEAAVGAARRHLHALAATPAPDPDTTLALRADASHLAVRAAQAALMTAKGAGFVAPHPAGRWARQALFFLVWSCPRPVADALFDDLLPAAGG